MFGSCARADLAETEQRGPERAVFPASLLGIMDNPARIDNQIDITDASVRHMPEVLEPGPANANLYEHEDEAPSFGAEQTSRYRDGTAYDNTAVEGQAELKFPGASLDDARRRPRLE